MTQGGCDKLWESLWWGERKILRNNHDSLFFLPLPCEQENSIQYKKCGTENSVPHFLYCKILKYRYFTVEIATLFHDFVENTSPTPHPWVEIRDSDIPNLLTNIFLTALARAKDSFWFSPAGPSGEA